MKVELTEVQKVDRQKIVEKLINYLTCMRHCRKTAVCNPNCRDLSKDIACFYELLGNDLDTNKDIMMLRKEVAILLNGLHEDN